MVQYVSWGSEGAGQVFMHYAGSAQAGDAGQRPTAQRTPYALGSRAFRSEREKHSARRPSAQRCELGWLECSDDGFRRVPQIRS